MHFITGKHMPRRTFIRGAMGAAVALPFLDAMVAAKGAGAKAAAAADRTRLICIEEVHGLAGCNKWAPRRTCSRRPRPARPSRYPTARCRRSSRIAST